MGSGMKRPRRPSAFDLFGHYFYCPNLFPYSSEEMNAFLPKLTSTCFVCGGTHDL